MHPPKDPNYIPRVTIRDAHELSAKLTGLVKYRTLKEILLQGQTDLDYYDFEIAQLKALIGDLEAKRSCLDAYLQDCRSLISPIQNLPPELLSEIFMLTCDPAGSNEFGSAYWVPSGKPRHRPAFQLSTVCSRWRQVALSTPGLWSKMNISFVHSWPSWIPSAIETCLQRSRQVPLALSLEGSIDNLLRDDWRTVLSSLAQQSHRWRSVSFNLAVKPSFRPNFIDLLSLHTFPLLHSLTISAAGQWVTLPEHSVFRETPDLRLLQLNSETAAKSWHWSQGVYNHHITSLTLQYTNLRDTIDILRRCPGLVSLKYTHRLHKAEHIALRDNLEAGTVLPVCLEDLSSLSIITPQDNVSSTITLLGSLLQLPALKSLTMEQISSYLFTDMSWMEAFCVFLRETSCSDSLTKLRFKSFCPGDGIDSMLSLVPNLKEFRFCSIRNADADWDGIIACLRLPPSGSSMDPPSTIFLPRLQHISLHIPHAASFDFDSFAEGIRSRRLPASEISVDRLCSVGLKLKRSHLKILEDTYRYDDLLDLEVGGLIFGLELYGE
ncbi:hypothetical protein D9758_017157 [Tetrapyrgos nigripes]|uniref:F-box domain-containing protein n=1 Tax=Tetrapyrgos nigripes TaxID=182062 RepID=A0A8H5BV86_9AGAR|nr:hypothetical protein D9758_017157 [Tetrapyrgos nigripes]